jgi:phosphoribosylpyrophosphate synthetase
MIVSNTLPQDSNYKNIDKLGIFDISNLMKEVIERIITGESISKLFV